MKGEVANEEDTVCERVTVHYPVTKIEAITEKMNTRE